MVPGGNSVTVVIGGNSAGLVDALRTATDQMEMTRQTALVLGDAASVMGAQAAESAAGWLDASTGAEEYGAKLDYLRAQIAMTEEQQAQMAATMGGEGASAGFFSGGLGGGLIGLFGGMGDAIEGAAGKMMGFVEQAGSMLAGLVSFSVLNDVIQEVQNFSDALITLNETTEKNVFSWQYLYGGMKNALSLAQFTRGFSMDVPFTRQDLIASISTLGAKFNMQQVEQYLPTIADYASTFGASGYGGQGVTMQQAARAISELLMGRSMMFKMAFNIDPSQLVPYGLDAKVNSMGGVHILDPNTLLPALEAYAKHRGIHGAAKDIAHETFWGEWSSFIDRVQNFELDTGKPLFGGLKQDLNDLSNWIDAHSGQISKFSDLIGNTLTGAFKWLTDAIGGVLTGVGESGLFAGLSQALGIANQSGTVGTNVGQSERRGSGKPVKPTGGTEVYEGAHGAATHGKTHLTEEMAPMKPPPVTGWQQAGQIIGGALKAIGEGWDAVSKAWSPVLSKAIHDLGGDWTKFTQSFSPEQKDDIKAIGAALLSIPWAVATGLVVGFSGALHVLGWILPPLLDWFRALAEGEGQGFTAIGNFLGKLGQLKDNLETWIKTLQKNGLQWGEDFIGNLGTGIKNNATAAIQGSLGGLHTLFDSWIAGLKNNATLWGLDLVLNLAQGMLNGIPVVSNAAGSVAGTISSFLHHSKPDTGPMANDDQWMPDMMAMFARGIRSGTTGVASAMAEMAQALLGAMRPTGGYLPGGVRGVGSVSSGGAGLTIVINGSSTLETMKLIDYAIARAAGAPNSLARVPGGMVRLGALGGVN